MAVEVLYNHTIDLCHDQTVVKSDLELYQDAAKRVLAYKLQNTSTPQKEHLSSTATQTWDGVDAALCVASNLPLLHSGPVNHHLTAGIELARLAAAADEPDAEHAFFVADLSRVYAQFVRWQACLPGIRPFYAVKCNPDPYVLRLLAALGTGFDCASHGEISQVLALGNVDPSRIIFANPCKALSFIRHARKDGVEAMTFDNADELIKISRTHPGAKLILRILTDDSKSVCRLGLKFGAPLQTVPHLLARAKDLDLNVIGVSFHVGSGCYDASAFSEAVALAKQAFDFGSEAGYIFSLLDVGGGFEDANFERTAAVLRASLIASFGEQLRSIEVIAEPGRFFVSGAFNLATNVIARRKGNGNDDPSDQISSHEEQSPEVMYYINDGVYGAFNCILFDHQKVEPRVLTLKGTGVVTPTKDLQYASIWGPTCDSIDCVSPLTLLPSSLEVGDWLGFENMGAYTICASSQFNGFERSSVTYTSGVGEHGAAVRKLLEGLAQRG